jgi:hypothetical protein
MGLCQSKIRGMVYYETHNGIIEHLICIDIA